jgi:hypothetical protein
MLSTAMFTRSWGKHTCETCDDAESGGYCCYPHGCYTTDEMVTNRILITYDPDVKPNKPSDLHCTIDMYIVSRENDKLEYMPSPVSGELVQWTNGRRTGEGDGVTSSVDFDFAFTTNDTDIDIFEPHIDDIKHILHIENSYRDVMHMLSKYINKDTTNKGKKKKNKKASEAHDRNNATMIASDVCYLKSTYEQMICGQMKFAKGNKRSISHENQIAKTFANVIVEYELGRIAKYGDLIKENKGCPHVCKR